VDAEKVPFDGKAGKYTLTFTENTLPPVDAFCSLTLYDRSKQLLVANPVDRYLINSAMLGPLRKTDDGNIVLYLQHESPGSEPAPGSGCKFLCGDEAVSAASRGVKRNMDTTTAQDAFAIGILPVDCGNADLGARLFVVLRFIRVG
jgi:hypothetical protein